MPKAQLVSPTLSYSHPFSHAQTHKHTRARTHTVYFALVSLHSLSPSVVFVSDDASLECPPGMLPWWLGKGDERERESRLLTLFPNSPSSLLLPLSVLTMPDHLLLPFVIPSPLTASPWQIPASLHQHSLLYILHLILYILSIFTYSYLRNMNPTVAPIHGRVGLCMRVKLWASQCRLCTYIVWEREAWSLVDFFISLIIKCV